jgi:threonine dehydratase
MSAGNHAQAVAYAARQFGIASTILMPKDAPRLKLENTKKYGAEVITYDRATEDREAIGQRLAQERDLQIIHPYNDLRTIAGQGTIGLEIKQQADEMGISPDVILVNCSGGGMSAGIALTRSLYASPPQFYTTEPAEFDDMQRSLDAGTALTNAKQSGTICDALTAPSPGSNPLEILLGQKVKGLTATDDEVKAAMSLAMEHFKLVLEPGGAVALACAGLNRKLFRGKTVVVVASGGNVDSDKYTQFLQEGVAFREKLVG